MSDDNRTGIDIADPGSFDPSDDGPTTGNPIAFDDYPEVLERARARSGGDESVQAGRASIGGFEVELALFDFDFLGGSMGEVAGERLALAMERAAARSVPFVLRTSTGGARMQEGMRSLIQMPKLVSARKELTRAHAPFVAILGHPTTGGVLASIAALADVTVAEADATIGFAGPRVVERFTGDPLPPGSHTATSAYAHGLVDELVPRSDVHAFVAGLLKTIAVNTPEEMEVPAALTAKPAEPWEAVQTARAQNRPKAPDLLMASADLFVELRGDRAGSDDSALLCGLARIAGRRMLVMGLDRSHPPPPAAYRKAIRCVRVAGRLDLPIVTLVDTPGADPSAPSESGGVAWHVGALFDALMSSPVPVLSIVTGELGSGGGLAFAAGDEVVMYHDAIASVIGPEMAAEILWKSPTRAPDAARVLKLTAGDLFDLDIADWVVEADLNEASLRFVITDAIDRLIHSSVEDWSASRMSRWRARGE